MSWLFGTQNIGEPTAAEIAEASSAVDNTKADQYTMLGQGRLTVPKGFSGATLSVKVLGTGDEEDVYSIALTGNPNGKLDIRECLLTQPSLPTALRSTFDFTAIGTRTVTADIKKELYSADITSGVAKLLFSLDLNEKVEAGHDPIEPITSELEFQTLVRNKRIDSMVPQVPHVSVVKGADGKYTLETSASAMTTLADMKADCKDATKKHCYTAGMFIPRTLYTLGTGTWFTLRHPVQAADFARTSLVGALGGTIPAPETKDKGTKKQSEDNVIVDIPQSENNGGNTTKAED